VDEDLLRILDNRAGFHIRRVDEEFNCGKVRLYKADRILYNFDTIWESVESAMNRKKETKRKYLSIIEEFYYVATLNNFELKKQRGNYLSELLSNNLGAKVDEIMIRKLKLPTSKSKFSRERRDEYIKEVLKKTEPTESMSYVSDIVKRKLIEERLPYSISRYSIAKIRDELFGGKIYKEDKVREIILKEYKGKQIDGNAVKEIAKKAHASKNTVRRVLKNMIKEGEIPSKNRITHIQKRKEDLKKVISVVKKYIEENDIEYIPYKVLMRKSGATKIKDMSWLNYRKTKEEILNAIPEIKIITDREEKNKKLYEELNKRLESLADLVGGFEKLDEYSIYGLWISTGADDFVSHERFTDLIYFGKLIIKREFVPQDMVGAELAKKKVEAYLSLHPYKINIKDLWEKSSAKDVISYRVFLRLVRSNFIKIPTNSNPTFEKRNN
ncbi:MAG: hypothetical protein J7K22_03365, partial [Nanoarchaeota archaeon]|nr:hypothetical protein [Nanoarchaeota archaeon]